MEIEVKVAGFIEAPLTGSPILILENLKDPTKIVPVWIGLLETVAIETGLEGLKMIRPQTHDLLNTFADEAGVVTKVVVTELKENTYYAMIHLIKPGENAKLIDSRPSDAIALALRCGCPIYVEEQLFDLPNQSTTQTGYPVGTSMTEEEMNEILKNLDTKKSH